MGYETCRFAKEVSDALICPVCLSVLEDPYQCADDHCYCFKCITEWIGVQASCPKDRKPLLLRDIKPANRLIRMLLNEMEVTCRYAEFGCKEVLKVEIEASHAAQCAFNLEKYNALMNELNQLAVRELAKDAQIRDLRYITGQLSSTNDQLRQDMGTLSREMKEHVAGVTMKLDLKMTKLLVMKADLEDDIIKRIESHWKKNVKSDLGQLCIRVTQLEDDRSKSSPTPTCMSNNSSNDTLSTNLNASTLSASNSRVKGAKMNSREIRSEHLRITLPSTKTAPSSLCGNQVNLEMSNNQPLPSVSNVENVELNNSNAEQPSRPTLNRNDLPVTEDVKAGAHVPPVVTFEHLTKEDFGCCPVMVPDDLVRRLEPLHSGVPLKNILPEEGRVRDIFYHVRLDKVFHDVPPERELRKLVVQAKHIDATIVHRKGCKVLLIGGNLFLAVLTAILTGPNGSVYCASFQRGSLLAAKFSHLQKSKRLMQSSAINTMKFDWQQHAPYDLILCPSANYKDDISKQLDLTGLAFDYVEGCTLETGYPF